MSTYLFEKKYSIFVGIGSLSFINFYFAILCKSSVKISDLIYLDLLFVALGLALLAIHYRKWKRFNDLCERETFTERNQDLKELLGPQCFRFLLQEEKQWKQERQQMQEEITELTDYITKWAHEVKLPLSSLRLMNERNPEEGLRQDMQERLEHLQQLVNTMLVSSKLKTLENDCKYEQVKLREVVQESLRNQSYFLIREHFQIDIDLKEITVYTDRRWLVYMLDQLIGNAVKYRRESPELKFGVSQLTEDQVVFWVEDNGIGIPKEELPFLFERGFIGSNLRGGDYHSTGMGLYFVKKIANRLQIGVEVSSTAGCYTRFTFCFQNNAAYLMR